MHTVIVKSHVFLSQLEVADSSYLQTYSRRGGRCRLPFQNQGFFSVCQIYIQNRNSSQGFLGYWWIKEGKKEPLQFLKHNEVLGHRVFDGDFYWITSSTTESARINCCFRCETNSGIKLKLSSRTVYNQNPSDYVRHMQYIMDWMYLTIRPSALWCLSEGYVNVVSVIKAAANKIFPLSII